MAIRRSVGIALLIAAGILSAPTASALTPVLPPAVICPAALEFTSEATRVHKLIHDTDDKYFACAAAQAGLSVATLVTWLDEPAARTRLFAATALSDRLVDERGVPRSLAQLAGAGGFPMSALDKFIVAFAAHYPSTGAANCGAGYPGYPYGIGNTAIASLAAMDKPDALVQQKVQGCLAAIRGQAVAIRSREQFEAFEGRDRRWLDADPLPPDLVPLLRTRARSDSTLWWPLEALGTIHTGQAAMALLELKAFYCDKYEKKRCPLVNVGPPAVPALMRFLGRSRKLDDQVEIANILERIGTPESRQAAASFVTRAMPALLAHLQRPEPYALESGAETASVLRFRTLGALARGAGPGLRRLLKSPDLSVRARAARALGHVRAFDAMPALLAMRKRSRPPGESDQQRQFSESIETRIAINAIADLESAPDFLAHQSNAFLIRVAQQENDQQWRDTAAVSELARRGKDSVPALLAVLTGRKRQAHATQGSTLAVEKLIAMGSAAQEALPHLIRFLNDRDLQFMLSDKTRPLYLARMGVRNAAVVEQLFRQVTDNADSLGRYYSARALAGFEPLPPEMSAQLRTMFARPELWDVNHGKPPYELVHLVDGIALPVAPAMPVLPAIADAVTSLRTGRGCTALPGSCMALVMHGSAAVPSLLALLDDSDPLIRQLASDILGAIGSGASAAVPRMSALLRDDVPLVRQVAVDNLGRISKDPASVPALLDYLLQSLAGSDGKQRYLAAAALARFDRLPAQVLPRLLAALHDARLGHAQESLLDAIMLTRSPARVTVLLDYLKASTGEVGRDNAVRRLVALGPDAVPAIIEALPSVSDIDQQIALARALAGVQDSSAAAASQRLVSRLLPGIVADVAVPDDAGAWPVDSRRAAAWRLASLLRFSPDAFEPVALALRHTDPRIREIAVYALSPVPGSAAADLLEGAATDPNSFVRSAAQMAQSQRRSSLR